jgi:hypothetical protein
MKKTIIFFISLSISFLLIILPYKEYLTLIPDTTIKITIYGEIIKLFTPGIWTHVAFLFVLLPPLLFLQIGRASLKIYKRILFLIEGIAAFFAIFLMFVIMSINPLSLERFVTIRPLFYLSLCWVFLAAIAAILLMSENVYDKIVRFLFS